MYLATGFYKSESNAFLPFKIESLIHHQVLIISIKVILSA